ncbi:MAG: hypothetical protein FWD16_07245 [Clostridia bacterium]|nr:hypothetical protein [Clostridia bacterium]
MEKKFVWGTIALVVVVLAAALVAYYVMGDENGSNKLQDGIYESNYIGRAFHGGSTTTISVKGNEIRDRFETYEYEIKGNEIKLTQKTAMVYGSTAGSISIFLFERKSESIILIDDLPFTLKP